MELAPFSTQGSQNCLGFCRLSKTGGESGIPRTRFRDPQCLQRFPAHLSQPQQFSDFCYCRRFRPFAGFCRSFYFNDTRNGTRLHFAVTELTASISCGAKRRSVACCCQVALRFLDCSRSKHLNGQCTNGGLCFATRRSHIKVNRNGVRSRTEIGLQR